ncbi:FecR family protein [Sphingobacterium pedocola]|uniref:FecR family protein n=1 Tax=Sphingobacterium pedocola TaxID=2082722 RepID=A0ABR9TA89_9SPHI|nr:FecR family protein [Sphingobacterium pedocola]MBE8721999.1 hypothetical protein [Sphingobacterium pedocola]
MKKTDRVVYLLRRHIEATLTEEEQLELDDWVNISPEYRHLLDTVSDPKLLLSALVDFEEVYGENESGAIKRTKRRIKERINKASSTKKTRLYRMRWQQYAAVIFLILIAGVAVWEVNGVRKVESQSAVVTDIEPGGRKAVLTLADGRKVTLREDQGSILLENGSMHYADGSTVLADGEVSIADTDFVSVSVPKGGVYQVVLSDGTEVWLNSSSQLRYPARFAGSTRAVELKGEGYFAVRSLNKGGRRYPFVVKTRQQEIEVLGTQFNVSAYTDQREVVTTLVEGSVSIMPEYTSANAFLLKSGYQSAVSINGRSIRQVNTSQYTAWKDDLFYFKNTSFADMMKQISRWYDVDVIYKGKVPKDTFSGKMSRSLSLMTVLELLNLSSVNVQIKGKSVVVN